MKNLLGKQQLLVVALLLAIGGGGYYFFAGQSGTGAVANMSGAAAASAEEEDLINQLLELKSLRLDESIFSDPHFRSLTDFSVTIPPEPVGRSNPFLPIGVGQAVTAP